MSGSVFSRRNVIKGLQTLETILFPSRCWLCDSWSVQPSKPLCATCLGQMEVVARPRCPTCSLPLQNSDDECPDCRHWPEPRVVVRAPFRFEGAVRRLIHRAKFNGAAELGPIAAKLMLPYAVKWYGADTRWRLVPVPSHDRTLWEKGYSFPAIMARFLARDMQRNVFPTALSKISLTPPQRELKADLRRDNPAGTFAVRQPKNIENQSILLIDDVATTCATVHHAAKALVDGGAARVEALVLARSVR